MRAPEPSHTSTPRVSPPEGVQNETLERRSQSRLSHMCLDSPLPSSPSQAPKPTTKGGRRTDQNVRGPPAPYRTSPGTPRDSVTTRTSKRLSKSSSSHGHGAGNLSANCGCDWRCLISSRGQSMNADSQSARHMPRGLWARGRLPLSFQMLKTSAPLCRVGNATTA